MNWPRPLGPPSLRFSRGAEARLEAMGVRRTLVSLTHERTTPRRRCCCCARSGEVVCCASGFLALVLAGGGGRSPGWATLPPGDSAPSLQPGPQRGLARAPLAGAGARARRWRICLRARAARRRLRLPHLIPFNARRAAALHSREQMRAFLAVARRVAPGMKVLPWVGGLRVGYRRAAPGHRRPGDLGQRQRIVAECRGLIDEGFDGIHVNVEPVTTATMTSSRSCARCAPPSARTASSPSPPSGRPVRPAHRPEFRVDAATTTAGWPLVADQIVVMAYDTALPTPAPLSALPGLRRASVTAHPGPLPARVLVGVPTYDETGLMHRGEWRHRRTRSSGWWPACAAWARAAPSKGSRSTRSGPPTPRSGPSTSASGAARA